MKSLRPDWADVELAAPNHVLTRAELNTLGVTQRMIWARVRPGGPWKRVLPGVILLRNGMPTPDQAVAAALRYAGEGAVITGLTAARLHGLNRFPPSDRVHVLVPHRRQRTSTGLAIVERTTRMPPTMSRNGLPVAEPARAVLDAARRMTRRDTVEALVAEAVQRGFTTPGKLWHELHAGSGRGSALPREALRPILEGARSTIECDAVRLAAKSGLPPMRWNVPLRTSTGRVLPTPDGWIDDEGVAWELDSLEWHLSPADYARTLERHAIMTGAGIIVVHTLPSRLRTEPDAVITELRNAYARACERPRPDIIAG